MAVDFKGAHFPKSVIVHAVFFYVRYPFPIVNCRRSLMNEASPLTMQP